MLGFTVTEVCRRCEKTVYMRITPLRIEKLTWTRSVIMGLRGRDALTGLYHSRMPF